MSRTMDKINTPAPCLVCGRELKPIFSDISGHRQPDGATMFTTHGNYGSTVFDELDGTQLQINICDGCLKERSGRAHLLIVRRQREEIDAYSWGI